MRHQQEGEILCDKAKKEIGEVFDALRLASHKLDHIREPILQQDRKMIEVKIKQLQQCDGEGWAIAEVVQRILDI